MFNPRRLRRWTLPMSGCSKTRSLRSSAVLPICRRPYTCTSNGLAWRMSRSKSASSCSRWKKATSDITNNCSKDYYFQKQLSRVICTFNRLSHRCIGGSINDPRPSNCDSPLINLSQRPTKATSRSPSPIGSRRLLPAKHWQ